MHKSATVAQLRALLEDMPDDAEVRVGHSGTWSDIHPRWSELGDPSGDGQILWLADWWDGCKELGDDPWRDGEGA